MALILTYAMSFLGVPYKWGGNNPVEGFDCSGFVLECLNVLEDRPLRDTTSQGIYDFYKDKVEVRSQLSEGSILFFGRSRSEISHIAMAIDDKLMIEAGGGDRLTKTLEDAKKKNAFVRIRPIKNRHDLVAVIKI